MTEQTQPTDAREPCPFCGSSRIGVHRHKQRRAVGYKAMCLDCGVTQSGVAYPDIAQATSAWNTRAKWGTPAGAGRFEVTEAECEAAVLELETEDLSPTPQPTQAQAGAVVITTDSDTGQCVAVTRQDDEGRVLSVIWQAPEAQAVAVPAEFLRSVIALCTQRGYSPENIEAWSKDDKWVADLWRQADEMLTIKGADHG